MIEILNIADNVNAALVSVDDTTSMFASKGVRVRTVPGSPKDTYVEWGEDNMLPYKIAELIGSDEVTSQNKLFNVLTAYRGGIHLVDAVTRAPLDRTDKAFRWFRTNGLSTYFLEQLTDLKYFYFSVAVLILSKDGLKINKLVHKDACYTRLAPSDAKGNIPFIYYGDWENASGSSTFEKIPLLDLTDPMGDLLVKLGREVGADGLCRKRTEARKFAVLMRFPTVGCRYYPIPYYASMFRGGSYDEKRLITQAKLAKFRNHASIRYQVEVHRDYWNRVCREENIVDPLKQQARIKKEKENIRDFVAGLRNSGKAWITGYFTDPNGNEVRDIRVSVIDTKKEGGDYGDDVNVAANTLCYADNTHPNLVGAVPGRSQTTTNSSDKNQLFFMKQSLERAFHDILLRPLEMVLEFNGYTHADFSIPMIKLNN